MFILVVCVFVYVMGYAVMFNFFETSSLLNVTPDGLVRYGYMRLFREMAFDVLLIVCGYGILSAYSFHMVLCSYLVVMGSLKCWMYWDLLMYAIRAKRYEDDSND